MSPLMQSALESKNERRKRLMALPYSEKVRMVEQMRVAAREIKLVAAGRLILREDAAIYGEKKHES